MLETFAMKCTNIANPHSFDLHNDNISWGVVNWAFDYDMKLFLLFSMIMLIMARLRLGIASRVAGWVAVMALGFSMPREASFRSQNSFHYDFFGHHLPCAVVTLFFDDIARRWKYVIAKKTIAGGVALVGLAMTNRRALISVGDVRIDQIIAQLPLQFGIVLFAHSSRVHIADILKPITANGMAIMLTHRLVDVTMPRYFPTLAQNSSSAFRVFVRLPTFFCWTMLVSFILTATIVRPWERFSSFMYDRLIPWPLLRHAATLSILFMILALHGQSICRGM
jgi:hypothetical protein